MLGKSLDALGHSHDLNGQQWLTSTVREGLRLSGLSEKEAAYTMGIDPSLLSRFWTDEKSLDVRKLARLSDGFWCAFIPLLAHRFSLQVRTQNRRRDVLAQVLQVALDELIDDGADVLPAKAGPPLKAELETSVIQTRRRA